MIETRNKDVNRFRGSWGLGITFNCLICERQTKPTEELRKALAKFGSGVSFELARSLQNRAR
jgi:hypothetical protein